VGVITGAVAGVLVAVAAVGALAAPMISRQRQRHGVGQQGLQPAPANVMPAGAAAMHYPAGQPVHRVGDVAGEGPKLVATASPGRPAPNRV
jgi:hypothetical protein